MSDTFYIRDAMDIAGSPVTLGSVQFVKVQTAIFCYGSTTGVGDISTEITYTDFAGKTTDFPMPD
jgi:hypothetical protein